MVRRLTVFAKEPVAGAVKTRLAAGLGTERAARLYEAFLSDLAAELTHGTWERVLAHAEAEAGPRLRAHFAGWVFRRQGEGGLGERLARSFEADRDGGAELVVVTGSDAPTLTASDVGRAFARLTDGADVVLAPSPDGGYALVGLSRVVDPRAIFGRVRWSTAEARHDTVSAAERAGYRAELLPEVPDVDVLEDLVELRRSLAAAPALAPATRRILFGP